MRVEASGLSYSFTCPKCSGSFSIELDRIPPVQARFRCPSCKQPMDFPSRDEARVYATLARGTPAPAAPARPSAPKAVAAVEDPSAGPPDTTRFRIEKSGFESDVFDRRGLRNLIRAGELSGQDRIRVDDADPVLAGDVPYLKSLFSLRKTSSASPPACCRTHTERVAFFKCHDSARPLCEECAPAKKFGSTTIRVCQHCGGTADDLPLA
jgi:predicted Zn finger-like uncharacterized protein